MKERQDEQDDFVLPENTLEPREEGGGLRERRGRVRRDREEDGEPGRKAPRILRFVAWLGLVVLFFAVGYGGASYGLKILSQKKILPRKDVVQDAKGAAELMGGKENVSLGAKKISVTLSLPKDGSIVQEKLPILSDLMEDDIRTCVGKIAEVSGIPKETSLIHIFRGGDVVFLDFDSRFPDALAKIGERNSLLFITAVIRTLRENFPPIAVVRFLVKGQVTRGSAPVDLTVPWKLPE